MICRLAAQQSGRAFVRKRVPTLSAMAVMALLSPCIGNGQATAADDSASPAAPVPFLRPRIILPKSGGDAVIMTFADAGRVAQEDASHWLNVYVMDASAPERSHAAIQGRYTIRADAIRFTPLFPFTAGQSYRVEWRDFDAPNTPLHVAVFRLADKDIAAPPRVVGIAPTAPTLPANTLRFYITFSRSLRGIFDRHMVRLADDADHDITNAFMEFGQELWSADGTRLTLLFDPGRIKRGVTANRTAGNPLVPGHRYTLAVSLPNGPKFAATFRVSGPLRTLLDPNRWHLAPPKAGTRAPLVVRFDRTMDEVLLRDAIAVYSANGKQIAGTAASADGARKWLFTPVAAWGRSAYRVVFGSELEDVCGNRIGEALDHEMSATQEGKEAARVFRAR